MSDDWNPEDIEPEWGFADPDLEERHEVPASVIDVDRQELADRVDDAAELVDVAALKAEAVEADGAPTWKVAQAAHELSKAQRAHGRALAALAAYDARPAVDETPNAAPPQLVFSNVDHFVRDWLIVVYRRKIDGNQSCWAAEWWRYDEAVARLEALWRAWEAMRLDAATGMSAWFRDHADHHMPILMSPTGPFARATAATDKNERGGLLPYAPPPEGMFVDEKTRPV